MTCPSCLPGFPCLVCGSILPPEQVVMPPRRPGKITPTRRVTNRSLRLRRRLAKLESERVIASALGLGANYDAPIQEITDAIDAEECI